MVVPRCAWADESVTTASGVLWSASWVTFGSEAPPTVAMASTGWVSPTLAAVGTEIEADHLPSAADMAVAYWVPS